MELDHRVALLEELVWVLAARGSSGVSLNRQSSINGDPDSGQFVVYQQSYIPQGSYTLIIGGITVTPSSDTDDILFELVQHGSTFGAPDATSVGTIVNGSLAFIDGDRPAGTLTNYGIRATNKSSGHTVSLLANQAWLNLVDFL